MFSMWLNVSGAIMTKGYRRKLWAAAQGQILAPIPRSGAATPLRPANFTPTRAGSNTLQRGAQLKWKHGSGG